jgi:hypothetical protein
MMACGLGMKGTDMQTGTELHASDRMSASAARVCVSLIIGVVALGATMGLLEIDNLRWFFGWFVFLPLANVLFAMTIWFFLAWGTEPDD